MSACAPIRDRILQLNHLPPLPATATRLLQAVADPDIEIDALAEIVGLDPGLSARILGLANAAFYARSRPVNTVREAIIRVLGLNMVKSLALSIAMAGSFDTSRCRAFDLRAYWFDALATAHLARQLARGITGDRRPELESVYLCGLLRNLGSLVLVHLVPEPMERVYRTLAADPGADRVALERELVGLDSNRAGAWLAESWRMPEVVVRVIEAPVGGELGGAFALEAALVNGAAAWVAARRLPAPRPLVADAALASATGLAPERVEAVEATFCEQDEQLAGLAALLA